MFRMEVTTIQLRDYQKECIEKIQSMPPGSYLVQMPTGCGKTATFTHIPRKGRVLVLAHREELVRQPAKYYDCPVGFEIAAEHSHGEDVVIASVQSLVRRLERFNPHDFDMIITDEAHHAAAGTYKKIYDHFTPDKHIGFTATPNRGDKARLDDVYSEIIFQRDLRWAIQSGFLCDIYCLRVNIGFDLSSVTVRNGDYAPGELDEAMDGTADAIAQAYREHAKGATL
ncbi:MAG: DEAD/DEAH box helicase family protein, partial [Clostridia bacterium]|nr:DEAD/DEAH box helicase family protein [Clostridia bacterium]